jgi:hypothetical protein
MWHLCEEHMHEGSAWQGLLAAYCQHLCETNPTQQEMIDHWYRVCKVQFPVYLKYWKGHKEVQGFKPLLQEMTFAVPYTLPSNRIVKLRGKWDSVDMTKVNKKTELYLQENKTKGDINEQKIVRQLSMDLQTMIYLVTLKQVGKQLNLPIEYLRGVRYNVIRRPLSGGRHSITRHKPTAKNPQGESKDAFYTRLGEEIQSEPEFFFIRHTVEVSNSDILTFRERVLNPILEQLCNWWEDIQAYENPFHSHNHWQTPFGIGGVLDEYGSDLDEYLISGSMSGLQRITNLFPELQLGEK